MGKNELTERYIYAVTKRMKPALKKDVAAELETIIQDMLEERCQDVLPTDRDVRVVLAELGTPAELAQKYDTDSNGCLIGPPYYATYKYVLKIVIICGTGGMLLAQLIAALTTQTAWYEAVWNTLSGIVGGMLIAFGIVTLLFAFFYKKGIKLENMNDTIDNLPPVPEKKKRISKTDGIVGIVLSVIFAVVFLVCPQIVCFGWAKDGAVSMQPLFNVAYIHNTWYFVIIFAVLGIARDSMKLIDGSYTKRLMIVTVVTDVISLILTGVWMLNDKIMNPQFFAVASEWFQGEGAFIGNVFGNFNMFFFGVIAFAIVLDMLVTVIHTLNNRGECAS